MPFSLFELGEDGFLQWRQAGGGLIVMFGHVPAEAGDSFKGLAGRAIVHDALAQRNRTRIGADQGGHVGNDGALHVLHAP